MGKGQVYPAEAVMTTDPGTGAAIRQVTSHPSIHHHPFYYIPAYDDGMHRLFFISHRTGSPQVFAEDRDNGQLVQLTDRPDLGEWSVHPSYDGRYVYYTAGAALWRTDAETFEEQCLAEFGDVPMREKGMVGAAMGTTTLSRDDEWWAVPVKVGEVAQFVVIDTRTGSRDVILERDTIGHPQFHPDDPMLLRYAGPYYDRLWVIRRNGSGNRLVYRRDAAQKEWIVHETWMPGRRELVTTNWPHGMIGVDIDTGAVRPVCTFNAWHPMVNRSGTLMVADTNCPDVGLQLFDPQDGVGEPRPLCGSEASNAGEHWRTDHCPYDDGPVTVYAPQHTHPHPNFSPDGRHVVFTSDRTGHAQVYEVQIPLELLLGDDKRLA
jgi:oligogalacturonide lyase